MKRGKRIAIVLLVCAIAGIIGGVASRHPEPRYGGKRLSEWLRGTRTRVTWFKVLLPEDNLYAIKQIGTNALPLLLKRLEAIPPTWEELITSKVPMLWRFGNGDDERAAEAIAGFYALGEQAQGAVPALVGMVRGTNPLIRARAALALGCIGKPAVPQLLDLLIHWRALKSFNPTQLQGAWQILGTNAAPAVPILIEHLDDQDPVISGTATDFLLAIASARVETNAITQAICKQLDSPKANERRNAAVALGEIADYRTVPLLQKALNDPDTFTRRAAASALRTMQIQAASAQGALEQTTSDQSTSNDVNNAVH